MYQFADIISQYWHIAVILVLGYVFSDMHRYKNSFSALIKCLDK